MVALPEGRNLDVAKAIAGWPEVPIGRVLHDRQIELAAGSLERRAADREQWTPELAAIREWAPSRDSGQTASARSAAKPEQHGFELIFEVVAEKDGVCPVLIAESTEERVAGGAELGFPGVAGCDLEGLESKAEGLSQLTDLIASFVPPRVDSVVDVDDSERRSSEPRPCSRSQESRRVHSARAGHPDRAPDFTPSEEGFDRLLDRDQGRGLGRVEHGSPGP